MQHILTSHNYLTKAISSFFELAVESLSSLGESFIRSRQVQANKQIATMVRHEYPDMTLIAIEDMLNRQTMRLDILPKGDS